MEGLQDEQAQQLLDELALDPERASQKFTLGCALTVAVMKLWQGGMPPNVVHELVDMSAKYGLPADVRKVSSVWVYLAAYAVTKSLELGTSLDEVHQMAEMNLQVAAAVQAQMRERPA